MKYILLKYIICLWFFLRICFPVDNLAAEIVNFDREQQIGLLKSKIQQFIQNNNAPDDSLQIELNSVPKNLFTVLDPAITVSCRKQGLINGKTVFKIYYQKQKGFRDFYQIVATVKRFSRVFVLVRSIDRNHIIQENDLTSVVNEVNWPDTEIPVNLSTAIGKRAKRRIQKGRVLTQSMLEVVPLVERGKSLEMDVNSKNLLITLPVISHGNGQKGDIIKVRNVTNGVFYMAEIKNEKTVIYKSNKR